MTLIDDIRVVSTMLEEVVATREGAARVQLVASKQATRDPCQLH